MSMYSEIDNASGSIHFGPANLPVFLLAVHQKLVKEEENSLLHVPGGNLE